MYVYVGDRMYTMLCMRSFMRGDDIHNAHALSIRMMFMEYHKSHYGGSRNGECNNHEYGRCLSLVIVCSQVDVCAYQYDVMCNI